MQSKRHSFVEACAGTAFGFVVAFISQLLIYPKYGIVVSLGTNLSLTAIFTAISIVRGYYVRRLFNWWWGR